MIPVPILNQAKTQAQLSKVRINIYRLESGTYVVVPAGYDVPNEKLTFVGYVDRDGNFIKENNDRLPASD